MANIKLDWYNPDDTGDIDEIRLFRLNEGESANVNPNFIDPAYNGSYIGSDFLNDINDFISKSTQIHERPNPPHERPESYTDESLNPGTYHYGVFSHNAGGYGPGSTVTITV